MLQVRKGPDVHLGFAPVLGELKDTPILAVGRLGELRRDGWKRDGGWTESAASVAVSRYVWGSTPTSFADSHRV